MSFSNTSCGGKHHLHNDKKHNIEKEKEMRGAHEFRIIIRNSLNLHCSNLVCVRVECQKWKVVKHFLCWNCPFFGSFHSFSSSYYYKTILFRIIRLKHIFITLDFLKKKDVIFSLHFTSNTEIQWIEIKFFCHFLSEKSLIAMKYYRKKKFLSHIRKIYTIFLSPLYWLKLIFIF